MNNTRDQSPVLRLNGHEIPLDESETGRFGITKKELKNIIYTRLCSTKSGSRKQRALFAMVLKFMGIKTQGKPREELLKIYIEVLREMKHEGMVTFKSGKSATYVVVKLGS